MFPSKSVNDALNGFLVNGVKSSYGFHALTSTACLSDFDHLNLFELGSPAIFATGFVHLENVNCMSLILFVGAAFQVLNAIVRFYTADMVYLFLFRRCWIKKRICNQRMNRKLFLFSKKTEAYNAIAVKTYARAKNFWTFELRIPISSYIAKIRNAVNSFVAFDWTPFFEADKKLLRHFDLSLRERLISLGVRGGDNRSDADLFLPHGWRAWEGRTV